MDLVGREQEIGDDIRQTEKEGIAFDAVCGKGNHGGMWLTDSV